LKIALYIALQRRRFVPRGGCRALQLYCTALQSALHLYSSTALYTLHPLHPPSASGAGCALTTVPLCSCVAHLSGDDCIHLLARVVALTQVGTPKRNSGPNSFARSHNIRHGRSGAHSKKEFSDATTSGTGLARGGVSTKPHTTSDWGGISFGGIAQNSLCRESTMGTAGPVVAAR